MKAPAISITLGVQLLCCSLRKNSYRLGGSDEIEHLGKLCAGINQNVVEEIQTGKRLPIGFVYLHKIDESATVLRLLQNLKLSEKSVAASLGIRRRAGKTRNGRGVAECLAWDQFLMAVPQRFEGKGGCLGIAVYLAKISGVHGTEGENHTWVVPLKVIADSSMSLSMVVFCFSVFTGPWFLLKPLFSLSGKAFMGRGPLSPW